MIEVVTGKKGSPESYLFTRNTENLKGHVHKAKQKYMYVSGFIPRKNRVGRSDLNFIFS